MLALFALILNTLFFAGVTLLSLHSDDYNIYKRDWSFYLTTVALAALSGVAGVQALGTAFF